MLKNRRQSRRVFHKLELGRHEELISFSDIYEIYLMFLQLAHIV